jgi:pyruvate,water dikinase
MSDGSAATDITGTPGSPGRATGPGDVLVCRFTEPAWTALFGVVAAVVTETGGVLSHAAIVAREHGIPAVLAAPGVMTTLRDDETVTVDGGAGRVSAHEVS